MISKAMLLERLAHYGQQKRTHEANMQAAGGAVQAIEELLAATEALERAAATPPATASTTTGEIVQKALERLAALATPETSNAAVEEMVVQEADA